MARYRARRVSEANAQPLLARMPEGGASRDSHSGADRAPLRHPHSADAYAVGRITRGDLGEVVRPTTD